MANSSKRRANRQHFWRKLIGEQKESGESIKAFCRRHRVSEPSFFAWRKKLAASDGEAKPTFLPVQVPGGSPVSGIGVEIRLDAGCCVCVKPGFDPQTLRCVLAVLQGEPC